MAPKVEDDYTAISPIEVLSPLMFSCVENMRMAQQFDSPQTEAQLREIQDKLYHHSKEAYDADGRPAFKGLLEIMSAEATIVTAIHNIKSNHGSETPGVDFKTMRKDYLQRSHSWVIRDIHQSFAGKCVLGYHG